MATSRGAGRADTRFSDAYRRHERDVYAYARRRFGAQKAADVVADVFETAWRKLDSAPPHDEILPWLYRIAYLVSSNHRRRFTRNAKLEQSLGADGSARPGAVEDQIVVRDEVRRVVDAMSILRRADQEVLRLFVWEHLNAAEVGLVLGIKPEAAAQRLHRAKARLAREFERLENSSLRRTRKRGEGR